MTKYSEDAARLGRNYCGIDVSPDYVVDARRRVAKVGGDE